MNRTASDSLPVLNNPDALRGRSSATPGDGRPVTRPTRDPQGQRSSWLSEPKRSGLVRTLSGIHNLLEHVGTLPTSVLRARKGGHVRPRLLTHAVTFGCNARCVMCDSWKLPTGNELTTDEIGAIYGQLPTMDVVRLTGGEPFLRGDLPQIAEKAVRTMRPIYLQISSNGFQTERIVRFCEERQQSIPLELVLSIDGVGGYHDEIRGDSDAWNRVWRTVRSLAPRQPELNLHLVARQTITDSRGLDEYHCLSEQLATQNVEHQLVLAHAESAIYSKEQNRTLTFDDEGTFCTFSELDLNKLRTVLHNARQKARQLTWFRRKIRNYYLRGLQQRLLHGDSSKHPACQALHSHLRLLPNGDVPVCEFNSRIVGNLREQSFAKIWQATSTSEQRKWVRQCKGCWAENEVLPSAVYTFDVLGG